MHTIRMAGWVFLAGLVFFSSEARAVPVKNTTNSSVTQQRHRAASPSQKLLSQKEQQRLLGKRLLAQAEDNNQKGQADPIPGGNWPVGAWVLEGLGAAIVAGGLVCFALSAGRLTTRDKLIKEANEDIKNNGVSDVSAADVKSAEDDGIALNTAGWIVTGVGVGLVVVGAIWMFVHQPPKAKYVRRDGSSPAGSPTMAGFARPLSKGGPAPAVLLRAGM
ncbi:MAG: hypothetical protein H6728_10000 [Myxococcales bacterium]|nr:hypothetical protein [Myxococcales bacterium]MCB9643394.1 hypothetical protein [Myxococcales bacterium]